AGPGTPPDPPHVATQRGARASLGHRAREPLSALDAAVDGGERARDHAVARALAGDIERAEEWHTRREEGAERAEGAAHLDLPQHLAREWQPEQPGIELLTARLGASHHLPDH